jgi:hypothetical protein
MGALWSNHADHLLNLVNHNKGTEAHLYLEQLMLFPVDIQDKIIEDISVLPHCSNEAVAKILTRYTMAESNWH